MRSMTPARSRANWIGPPPLTGLWLEALLRVFAMLMSNAATVFRMRPSRLSRECHTDAMPAMLPGEARGSTSEETEEAAASSQSHEALMLVRRGPRSGRIDPVDQFERRTPRSGRPSKHKGGLTAREARGTPSPFQGEEKIRARLNG